MPWVLVSSGAVLMATGTALLLMSEGDSDRRDEMQDRWCAATACRGTVATRPETAESASYRQSAESAVEAGNAKQIAGFVVGGVGLVTAAVGTYLLARPAASKERATIAAAPLAGGGFASARFVF